MSIEVIEIRERWSKLIPLQSGF